MLSENQALSTFIDDPTLNKKQKAGKALPFSHKMVLNDSLFLCKCDHSSGSLNDVLKAKKCSETTINLFSKEIMIVCNNLSSIGVY